MALILVAVMGIGGWFVGAIVLALFVGVVIRLRESNGRKRRR